jgi:hypothetical protein
MANTTLELEHGGSGTLAAVAASPAVEAVLNRVIDYLKAR